MGYFGWSLAKEVVDYFFVAARFLEVSRGCIEMGGSGGLLLSNAVGRRHQVFFRVILPEIIIVWI